MRRTHHEPVFGLNPVCLLKVVVGLHKLPYVEPAHKWVAHHHVTSVGRWRQRDLYRIEVPEFLGIAAVEQSADKQASMAGAVDGACAHVVRQVCLGHAEHRLAAARRLHREPSAGSVWHVGVVVYRTPQRAEGHGRVDAAVVLDNGSLAGPAALVDGRVQAVVFAAVKRDVLEIFLIGLRPVGIGIPVAGNDTAQRRGHKCPLPRRHGNVHPCPVVYQLLGMQQLCAGLKVNVAADVDPEPLGG